MNTADLNRVPLKRALISVYDKTGLEELARGLHDAGVNIVSTGSTAGTIRGDLARDWGEKVQKNIVHGSDSSESAEREIGIWFA